MISHINFVCIFQLSPLSLNFDGFNFDSHKQTAVSIAIFPGSSNSVLKEWEKVYLLAEKLVKM